MRHMFSLAAAGLWLLNFTAVRGEGDKPIKWIFLSVWTTVDSKSTTERFDEFDGEWITQDAENYDTENKKPDGVDEMYEHVGNLVFRDMPDDYTYQFKVHSYVVDKEKSKSTEVRRAVSPAIIKLGPDVIVYCHSYTP